MRWTRPAAAALVVLATFTSIASLTTLAPWAAHAKVEKAFPKRRPAMDPIWLGEKHKFSVSFLGLTGLLVEMEVLPHESVKSRKAYHARARLQNSALVGVFYKIDDMVESWFDYDGLFSHRFHMVQNETKLDRETWENHDQAKGETTYKNRSQKKGEKLENSQVTAPIPRLVQDNFSAFYFLRGLPLDTGDSYRIPVVSEGNVMEVQATVLGGELLDYHGKSLQCLLIKLEKLDKSGNPIPRQNNLVWLSNDDRRMLMRVDVTTRLGHVVGKLEDFIPGTAPSSPPSATPSAQPSPQPSAEISAPSA